MAKRRFTRYKSLQIAKEMVRKQMKENGTEEIIKRMFSRDEEETKLQKRIRRVPWTSSTEETPC